MIPKLYPVFTLMVLVEALVLDAQESFHPEHLWTVPPGIAREMVLKHKPDLVPQA